MTILNVKVGICCDSENHQPPAVPLSSVHFQQKALINSLYTTKS